MVKYSEKWDRRFMSIAKEVASWSKDPSTKIGVVIVKNNKIVSTGYNGFPPGIADDERLHDREKKYPLVVHGEMNAVLQAGNDAYGSTMYLYSPFGGFPCQNCTKHAITAGVQRIVALPGEANERWKEDCEKAEATLDEAGVVRSVITLSDDQVESGWTYSND